MTGIRYIVMLACSHVRYAHMCSSGTRAQYEVKRVQKMKKADRYKMALRTALHLSEPGFSGFPDFQDYPYQGFPQRIRQNTRVVFCIGWECRSHLGEYTAKPHLPRLGFVSKVAIRRSLGQRKDCDRKVVMLVCSDVRDAHMCSSGTRARNLLVVAKVEFVYWLFQNVF